MEESYKGYLIVVAANGPDSKSKWMPTWRIFAQGSMRLLQEFRWELDYDTCEQAERVGLLVSKKIIDHWKSTPSSFSRLTHDSAQAAPLSPTTSDRANSG